jgi:FkbM family methyltransferase
LHAVLVRLRRELRRRIDEALFARGLALVSIGRFTWRRRRQASGDVELRGVTLRLGADWATPALREAVFAGNYEAFEAEIVQATLGPEDRVVEVGCGIGFIATLASRIVGDDAVHCYDANPDIAAIARETFDRNRVLAKVTTAVLAHKPVATTVQFFVTENFCTSSLIPTPGARSVTVPVLDAAVSITAHGGSYLIVDIEGAETDLLVPALPGCVRKLCVECHPAVSRPEPMLASLFAQGFVLSFEHSRPPVLYLER